MADPSPVFPAGPAPPVAPRPRPPLDIAGIIARNITPLAALFFFHTSPQSLVTLYAIDTMLSLVALCWLLMEHVTEATNPDRGVKRALKLGVSALLVGGILAAILGGPFVLIVGETEWVASKPWFDPDFRAAMIAQAVGCGYAMLQDHRHLQQVDDDEQFIGRRLVFLVARWVVLMAALFLGLAAFASTFIGGVLIVLVYIGASIYFELFPQKAERFFPGRKGVGNGTDREPPKQLPLP